MLVFVSHASADHDYTDRVVQVLNKYNIPYWIHVENVKHGTDLKIIKERVNECTHFLLLWSKNANDSKEKFGVQDEIDIFMKRGLVPECFWRFRIDGYDKLPNNIEESLVWKDVDESNLEIPVAATILANIPKKTEQISNFKDKVVEDFKNWKKQKKPMIENFKKFDGYNRYIPQGVSRIKDKKHLNNNCIDYVLDEINNEIKKDTFIPIVSDYGSGKSSLCHRIMYRLCDLKNEESENLFPIFIPLGDLPDRDKGYLDLDDFAEEIVKFIRKEYGLLIPSDEILSVILHNKKKSKIILEEIPSRYRKDFLNWMEKGKFVFIFDALDEMTDNVSHSIAQTNLKCIGEFSKIGNKVIVTSRHTYISGETEKLLQHLDMVFLEDFSKVNRKDFLDEFFKDEPLKISDVNSFTNDYNVNLLISKPLLFSIICENIDAFKKKPNEKIPKIINESSILEMITDKWIKHGAIKLKKSESNEEYIKNKRNIRQKCSEILAVELGREKKAIKISDVSERIKKEFSAIESEKLPEKYQKDAKDCTFLIPHEDNSFKFILESIREYLHARRIVNDIRQEQYEEAIYDIEKGISNQTSVFIKKILDIEWAVKPHILEDIKPKKYPPESMRKYKYRNNSDYVIKMLQDIQDHKDDKFKNTNVSVLVEILHYIGNFPNKISLSKLNLYETNLSGADLYGADLSGANLSGADLSGADLSGADLSEADLYETNLSGANLSETNLSGANLSEATLSGATLSGANLDRSNLNKTNLSGANLDGANLSEANLDGANLDGANLNGATLSGADLNGADLVKIALSGADLSGAHLREADLYGAHLREATLSGADLYGANLSGADLSGANLDGANLMGVVLKDVRNLSISHQEAEKRGALF